MNFVVTEEFVRRYQDLPPAVKKKAEKQKNLFRKNPFHPSLHTEKLEPKNKEMWSFRLDKRYRVIFKFVDGETALFLTIGPHDWIYKIKF